jgi:glycosyltransferase involved in cell wall biosynthesis
MRVLLLAETCNPSWPSLPSVGYNACVALAERVDTVLATHVRNRPAIEAKGAGRAKVVYIDNEYVARNLYRLTTFLRRGHSVAWTTNTGMAYLSNLAFEWEVWKRFRDELRAGAFDVVHRVTPMSPTNASLMARLSPVPFVLGPLNGGLKWPPGYGAELRREREWLAYARGLHRLLPWYRSTYAKSAAILAAFGHTIEDIPRSCRGRVVDFPEVGFNPEVFHPRSGPRPQRPVTVLFAGRLVPYKCPDVVVRAFVGSPGLAGARLIIVGEGPERPVLERLAGGAVNVEFWGNKTQSEVASIMRECDVFAFPSIRELGAGVVVEAMASGLACVVVDYGGPGSLIGSERGIKLPLEGKERLVELMSRELSSLAGDVPRIERLGRAASDYAFEHLTWGAKAERTVEIYRSVLARAGRPGMGSRRSGEPAPEHAQVGP